VKTSLNLTQFVKSRFEQLEQIRGAPQAVAGGVAIGMFWGFTPLLGLKTLLSIFLAWAFRCSKIAAVITVSLHDILTPIWPVILRWEYDLGVWILSHPHHFPERLSMKEVHLNYWLHLKRLEILWPMFVGSLLFAVPFALIADWIVEQFLERYKRRRHGPFSQASSRS
jgi:uncharacterized protein (DUF2062 family)